MKGEPATDATAATAGTYATDATEVEEARGSVRAVELDDDAMAHLQRLARLELAPEEVRSVREDLRALLAYVDQLQAADVDGLEPTASPVPPKDARRSDVPAEPLPQAEALRLAPASQDGFVRVPRTVEEG
ncbi:MAG: Asp-tRNA(Asn)/Glu-tRNA(Gln) amidotransferase subunit GatC [Trueperaceae bacterium]